MCQSYICDQYEHVVQTEPFRDPHAGVNTDDQEYGHQGKQDRDDDDARGTSGLGVDKVRQRP